MKRKELILIGLVLIWGIIILQGTIHSTSPTSDTLLSVNELPKKTLRLILIETGGGATLGGISGLGTLYLTWPKDDGDAFEYALQVGRSMVLSYTACYLGSILGVNFTGKRLREKGSFVGSLAGSIVGAAISTWVGAKVIGDGRSAVRNGGGIGIIIIGIPLGTALGYNRFF